MNSNKLRLLSLAAFLFIVPSLASAQTASQAQALLQSNPDLINQLRSRIMSSGLTADQVRERLKAEGYPANLLDAYLSGDSSGNGTGNAATTGTQDDVFNAISALGIVDTLDVTNLRCSQLVFGSDSTVTAADTIRIGKAAAIANRRALSADCARRRNALKPLDSAAKAQQDSGFTIFGLSTFRGSSTLFDPNLNGPVDSNYRLGPGDKLALILTGDVSQTYTLDVTREGFIVVPQAGQIYVNNLTLGQLEDILYQRLGRVYSGVRRGPGATTRFSISPVRLRSNQVFVLGDVLNPGSYRVSSAATALAALYTARGPTDNGSSFAPFRSSAAAGLSMSSTSTTI